VTNPTGDQHTALLTCVLQQAMARYPTRLSVVKIKYNPQGQFLFAARRDGATVRIETSLTFFNPQCSAVVSRAVQAANEILDGRTVAVAIRLPERN
jgi:hypothetical protein